MKTFSVLLSVAVVNGITLAACVGSDPGAGTPESDAGSSGSVETGAGPTPVNDAGNDGNSLAPDAAPPAGCPIECLPPASAGWTGPSAVYDGAPGTKPATCPSKYTQFEIEGHQGLKFDAAQCSCGAAAFSGQKCSVAIGRYAQNNCGDMGFGDGADSPAASTCSSALLSGGAVIVSPGGVAKGTCAYPSPTKTLPAETYEKSNVACGLPQNASCASRPDCVATPFPDLPYTRLCIWKNGDVQCPSADYAARFVTYKGKTETRDCTACTGLTSGGSCATKWGFSSLGGCTDGATAPTSHTANATTCVPNGGTYVNVRAMAPTGVTCTPSGAVPIGSVKSIDPVTFCCNK